MKRGGHDSCGVQRNERRDVAGAIRGLLYMARPASDVHGGSLSDVRAGTGDLCKGGDEGKRVATISAFRENSRFRLSRFETGQENQPERRHICSRLTLTLFFSPSDTQTTTPVCHYGPIPDGPPPKGRIERIGPVVTLICCCAYAGTATLSEERDREF